MYIYLRMLYCYSFFSSLITGYDINGTSPAETFNPFPVPPDNIYTSIYNCLQLLLQHLPHKLSILCSSIINSLLIINFQSWSGILFFSIYLHVAEKSLFLKFKTLLFCITSY